MGIPGLFKNCIQKYHNISGNKIIETIIREIIKRRSITDNSNENEPEFTEEPVKNRLFLDFNCAIYYVLKPEMKDINTLIIYTLDYLDTLCSLIPNLEFVYIALDGVPPRAKMEQQRARRFHSVKKKQRALKINEEYGDDLDKTDYNFHIDTNMITPGTEFMKKLTESIRNHIATSKLYQNVKVIFSDASIPGEGEHKILKYVKENPASDDMNTLIYGLDGDLIMLSLVSEEVNLYLVRESAQYGGYAKEHEGHKYLFLNIDNLRLALLNEFQEYMAFELDFTLCNRYIDDYIFLCLILGNDFVPKIHWYGLYEGGHDMLIGYYFEIHNHTEEFLVDREKGTINRVMLMDIFQMLSLNENKAIKKCLKKRSTMVIPVDDEMSERERQQLLIDFYPLQYLHIEEKIDPYSPRWHERYYSICCKFDNVGENIKMITDAYLKTLIWNFKYYFGGCPDWDYYYPYHYSPTTVDIFKALENISGDNLVANYKFNNNKPLEPQTLLMMVLPLSSSGLLAHDINRKLHNGNHELSIYFPKKYSLNVPFHRYYYECTANIPKFEMAHVKKFMKGINLTADEKERNQEGELYIKEMIEVKVEMGSRIII